MNRKYTNKQKNQMCIEHFKNGALPAEIASQFHTTKQRVQNILYSFKDKHYNIWLNNFRNEIMSDFKNYCDQQSALKSVKPKQYYLYLTSLISNPKSNQSINNIHLHNECIKLAKKSEANYHYGLLTSKKLSILKSMFDKLLDDYSRSKCKNDILLHANVKYRNKLGLNKN